MKSRDAAIITAFVLLAVISAVTALFSVKAAIVMMAGVMFGITIFYKPFIGLMLYVILLFVRPQDFVSSLAQLRIIMILAVIIILSLFTHRMLSKQKISLVPTQQHVFMLAFLLIVPLSDLSNMRLGGAWDSFNNMLTLFLSFFVIAAITGGKFKALYWSITLSCVFMALNGLLQHFRGMDMFGQTPENNRIVWVGIFGDPNDFCLALVSSTPLLLFNVFERKVKVIARVLMIVMLAVLLAAIYYTNSRGGQLALAAVLAAFAIKKWGIRRGVVAGVIFVTAAFVLAPSRMANISPYGMSESGRIFAWMDGLVILKSRPLFGIGFNQFAEHHGRAAHSAYIKCMAELGLIGYYVWLLLIYSSFKDLLSMERKFPGTDVAKYSRIAQVSMVGFLSSAYFLSQTYSPVIYILFALAASLSLYTSNKAPEKKYRLRPMELLIILGIEGISIVSYKVLAILY